MSASVWVRSLLSLLLLPGLLLSSGGRNYGNGPGAARCGKCCCCGLTTVCHCGDAAPGDTDQPPIPQCSCQAPTQPTVPQQPAGDIQLRLVRLTLPTPALDLPIVLVLLERRQPGDPSCVESWRAAPLCVLNCAWLI